MNDAVPASASTPVLPGTWKLAHGRAVTLHPQRDGILRVAHGRLWATVDGPHGRAPEDSGDHVLEPGRSLYVQARQRVVIESWNPGASCFFAWDPVAASAPARPALNASAVLQPLADLRAATALAGRALVQLAFGLGALAWHLLRRLLPARRWQRTAG